MVAIAVFSQTQTIWTVVNSRQALSKMSPGPECHAPGRSDVKKTIQRQELSCHSAREKLKIQGTVSKLRADSGIFSFCLGLQLQGYVFCDDGMKSDRLNQNNPGPENHFRN